MPDGERPLNDPVDLVFYEARLIDDAFPFLIVLRVEGEPVFGTMQNAAAKN